MSAKDNALPVYTADAVVLAPDAGQLCVLLIRRAADHDTEPGKLALPGGHVDRGEDALDAACRELAEETGLDLRVLVVKDGTGRIVGGIGLHRVGVYDAPGRDPRGPYSSTAYLARLPHTVPVTGMDDAEFAEWLPVDEALTAGLAFDHGLILRDALALAGVGVL